MWLTSSSLTPALSLTGSTKQTRAYRIQILWHDNGSGVEHISELQWTVQKDKRAQKVREINNGICATR